MTDESRIRILLIEDDAPLMRAMAWALTDDGFDVEVVSKRDALERRGLETFDVAVFNMSAAAPEKTAYNDHLRMLNPDCIIIDVDEFIRGGGSVRDSGADSYTPRPLNLEAVGKLIHEMVARSLPERQQLRADAEEELRPRKPSDPQPPTSA
jgi:DNA-binding response OmpR family regulator